MVRNKRSRIPSKIENKILYDSAYTCNVCRKQKGIQIHHIDQNPTNNNPENLIVLCLNCHDEAHSTHHLTKNLTPEKLLFFKKKWQNHIADTLSSTMMSCNNKGLLSNAFWTFINHEKVAQLVKSIGIGFNSSMLEILRNRGKVDEYGIPILENKSDDQKLITVYDHFDYGDSQRFHQMYSDAVDTVISDVKPIEISAIWSKREIKDLINPGCFIFLSRGFYFKSGKIVNNEEDRLVYGRAKNIELRWRANTRHMFGSSSLYNTYKGHQSITAFLFVKNISIENKLLIIDCTPLSMGVEFTHRSSISPYKSKLYTPRLYM